MNINKKKFGYKFGCCGEKSLRKCFRKEGARLTLPRKIIVDFFHSEKGHFTAEEVFEKLAKKYPGIGKATVYRTLSALYMAGVLNKYDFIKDKTLYELSCGHEGIKHHHHIVCSNCGKIVEYDNFMDEEKAFFDKLEKTLSSIYGFKIRGHSLYFYGLCKDCKKLI
ncbi:MAG: transcriptional repressor [Elusimicrobiota bacterium]